jgi:hypothetical protein
MLLKKIINFYSKIIFTEIHIVITLRIITRSIFFSDKKYFTFYIGVGVMY